MTVQAVPPSGCIAVLSCGELERRGLSAAALTPRQALSLAREACARAGVFPPLRPETEVFSASGELFLTVRPRAAGFWFPFSGSDRLRRGKSALTPPFPVAEAYRVGETWWLALPPTALRAAAELHNAGLRDAKFTTFPHAILRGAEQLPTEDASKILEKILKFEHFRRE